METKYESFLVQCNTKQHTTLSPQFPRGNREEDWHRRPYSPFLVSPSPPPPVSLCVYKWWESAGAETPTLSRRNGSESAQRTVSVFSGRGGPADKTHRLKRAKRKCAARTGHSGRERKPNMGRKKKKIKNTTWSKSDRGVRKIIIIKIK